MTRRTYIIRSRWLETGSGWKVEERTLEGSSYEQAGREASAEARRLEAAYSGDHFWTVDLENPDGGSYFQLFHGRLA